MRASSDRRSRPGLRGIGRAIAQRLAADGLAVSVADPPSTAEEPVALAAALSSDGCPALALSLDVSDAGQVEDAGAAHVERFGAWT